MCVCDRIALGIHLTCIDRFNEFYPHYFLCHDNYYAYKIELLCENVKSLVRFFFWSIICSHITIQFIKSYSRCWVFNLTIFVWIVVVFLRLYNNTWSIFFGKLDGVMGFCVRSEQKKRKKKSINVSEIQYKVSVNERETDVKMWIKFLLLKIITLLLHRWQKQYWCDPLYSWWLYWRRNHVTTSCLLLLFTLYVMIAVALASFFPFRLFRFLQSFVFSFFFFESTSFSKKSRTLMSSMNSCVIILIYMWYTCSKAHFHWSIDYRWKTPHKMKRKKK